MDIDAGNLGENPPTTPRHHDILWYPDGDVVLRADPYLFKVHKCILSLQSTVFRDMFAFPTAGFTEPVIDGADGVMETYEGLPLVALVGDDGEDVVHLLRTAYDRQYYHRDDDETPLKKITALLVLGTKYDFQGIRTDVIIQISRQYPMTLDEFCAIDVDWSPLFGTQRDACHYPLFAAVLKADVDFLLPALYYACADYGLLSLFACANSKSLHSHILEILTLGRDVLKNESNKLIAELPEVLRTGRFVGPDCPAEIFCGVVAHFAELESFCNKSDLKDIAGEIVTKKLEDACEVCVRDITKHIDERRQEIWDEVPSYFRFPPWADLKAKKDSICRPHRGDG